MGEKDVFGFEGKVLDDNYRVDEAVGEGGFGVVYRGWHLGFDEPVAIKCLKLPAHFTDEARVVFEQRFRDEGKLLKRLGERHHAVVKAYDVRILKGQGVPYLVLEWLEGETLDRVMARRLADGTGPFGEAEVVKLLSPVIEALALAHRGDLGQVVAHRDIKPENLLMVQGGDVKILDFGIAKAMAEGEGVSEQASKTSSGFSAFSPAFGAPEQFSSKKYGESGPWTDVHALGLVLSYLVTGRKPYGEADFSELLLEALSVDRPTPRSRGAQVSDGFEAACARALSLKSADRLATAGALLEALGGQVAERPASMSTGGPVSKPRPAATQLPEMATFHPGAAAPKKREPERRAPSAPSGRAASTQLAGARTFDPAQPDDVQEAPSTPTSGGAGKALVYGVGALLGVVSVLGYVVMRLNDGGEQAQEQPPKPEVAPMSEKQGRRAAPTAPEPARSARPASVGEAAKGGRVVKIEGGTFRMGDDDGAADQKPAHVVKVATFEMDVTEVTVAAYGACVESGGCSKSELTALPSCNWGKSGKEEHPVNCVDWSQAAAYCKWAGKRLPTEPEWEYAARGSGDQPRKFAWGSAEPGGKACFDRPNGGTCPVGSFPAGATPEGLLDMSGNVEEWTSTDHCKYSEGGYERCDGTKKKVGRGGAFFSPAKSLSAAGRFVHFPTDRFVGVGFRCAKSVGS